ncbi:hypothetical protein F2Q68_00002237 [Brassica cretica]|uniref:Uncharacterized protein n=1 Tax=Brassica cretica TaxID=69181 RepID=A0A8S9J885_BRACR|nr:hypothetical protein F2Q68_00002237 [Brassica cretica]
MIQGVHHQRYDATSAKSLGMFGSALASVSVSSCGGDYDSGSNDDDDDDDDDDGSFAGNYE